MEPPALTRRGEAQRISEAFNRDFAGKLTSVDGVSLLRKRLLYLCVNGESGFDASMLLALKTHVSLDEALLIEAIKCEAGDSRHQFQIWYGEYVKQNKASNQATLGTLDAAAVGEELKMTRQAIEEHERLLADHRLALMNGMPTMAPEDVDALHATINGLRANLPAIEAEYARLMSETGHG